MTIADAFSSAIDAAYAVHGEAATYVPRDGASVAVTVIYGIEPGAGAFDSGTRQTDAVLSVRVSEVADPKQGDTVTLADGTCHTVRSSYAINRWEWGLVVR